MYVYVCVYIYICEIKIQPSSRAWIQIFHHEILWDGRYWSDSPETQIMWDQLFTILLTCLALRRLKTCCTAYRHKLTVQFPRSHQLLCRSCVLHRFSVCCLHMTDGTWVTKLVLSLYNTFKCNVEAYFCYRPNPAHLF